MSTNFSRNLKDKDKEVTATLAQAGVNSPSIDLEQIEGGDIEQIVGQLVVPVTAGITDAKVLTFKLEDSADNSTFAAIDPLISTTATGAGGNGTPALDTRFRFPPVTRRYVRIAQTATSSSGTFTNDLTFRLLF
jgi:hypothetical protein